MCLMKKLVKRKKSFKEVVVDGCELRVNTDGSCVLHEGSPLNIHYVRNGERQYKAICVGNKKLYVHRLVALAWLGEPEDESKCKVMIKDADYSNIHYSNLQWVSSQELTLISDYRNYRRGRPKKHYDNSKIPKTEVPLILQRIANGETLRALAEEYATSDMSIHRLKKRFPGIWAEATGQVVDALD